MTKVQVRYELAQPLDETLQDHIARAHGHYGIALIRVEPSLTAITVDYDASRLAPTDVIAVLSRLGIPVIPNTPANAETVRPAEG